jgi:hypothetical protein
MPSASCGTSFSTTVLTSTKYKYEWHYDNPEHSWEGDHPFVKGACNTGEHHLLPQISPNTCDAIAYGKACKYSGSFLNKKKECFDASTSRTLSAQIVEVACK